MNRAYFAIAAGPCLAACASPAPPEASTKPLPTASVRAEPPPTACVLIVTDDDIPSGSPTAGAMYVEESELGRRLLTSDVAAVVEGFHRAGISCVWVADGHDGALDREPLEALGAHVVTTQDEGWKWPFFGVVPREPAVAALVGFHAPAGHATGFRPHTINDGVRRLEIDGIEAGEVAHLTLGLSALNIPVVLVSGDAAATEEAAVWASGAERVTVRWRGVQGESRFLTSEAAAVQLRDAASRVGRGPRPALRQRGSVAVRLAMNNRLAADSRANGAFEAWESLLAEEPELAGLMRGQPWSNTLSVRDGVASWRAPTQLTAFFTIGFCASYLRGADNWAEVSEGYAAYKVKDYEKATESYQRALDKNPHDVATKCRMAAVFLEQGDIRRARDLFAFGVEHLDDVGVGPMQSWCTIGLAKAEQRLGHPDAAKQAAERTLALPDVGERHLEARRIIESFARVDTK